MEKAADEGASLDRLDEAHSDVLDDKIVNVLSGKGDPRESSIIERACGSLESLVRRADALRESIPAMGDDESYDAELALIYFKNIRTQAREYGDALVRQGAGRADMDAESIEALNSVRSSGHERIFSSVLLCLQSLAMEPGSEKLQSFKHSLMGLLHGYGMPDAVADEDILHQVYAFQESLEQLRTGNYSPEEVDEFRQSEEFRELEALLREKGIDGAAIEGVYKALEHFALRSAFLDANELEKHGQKTAA